MTNYVAFNAQRAIDYVSTLIESKQCNFFDSGQTLSAYEFGDGNLNLVFRITDEQNNSVILKQALPYARCVGESWPLTLDRARIEAQVLLNHGAICPTYTANVLHYSEMQALTILEDLGNLQILRTAQNNAEQFPKLAQHVATYLSHTGFYNSDFYLTAQTKKALVSQFTNPELCQITEDLFFSDPYIEHERNNYPKQLQNEVDAIQKNNALKLEIAKLKANFLSNPQTLLHGDMHSGSIFVDCNNTKMIDPEFGFFGPIGFDIGSFIGNLLLNYCAQAGHIDDFVARRNYQTHLLSCIVDTYSLFEQQWLELIRTKTTDESLAPVGYAQYFMKNVLQDAVGYCGAELIRRTIGLAHVSDIDSISDDNARLTVQKQTLALGEQLILNAQTCNNKEAFFSLLISQLN
ncbi:S-methyl-5-thioribose kinase [Pseudoalteromonas sp. SR43-6]|uniref:S-methyl-5-thioribose kinase n=1 Tax=unclassified Pseudoalteromonas TaxID=194690 RepID=UPI0015F915B3|nr:MULTISPECIES: S-methyl-5-thioribose kinase [unclassified Pseudoalteromonas]MBB1282086.1 S-methyl-5-thioribose kinase [Pseudoalteromonas sp. SR41-1]MBB1290744.1 S-methyl-5-thioribose kinase [Pseudoalteromonas sp. SR41-5]MBB1351193.1 S-methyl-5-thioribose kinase [Pseudoalteromonas sp. SG45-3]MBB1359327.1 S-methyl-5-thioribose kinase [Pseudoalteromonas sp. SG45-6]MBB1376011.1 S-methyl-5-thioribose kinase [Pseudoalteromonas sp. SR43-6]